MPPWRRFVELAVGDGHVLARSSEGCVYAWGYDAHGQLGLGGTWRAEGTRRRGTDSDGVLREHVRVIL